jgi:hypothetical protein
MRLVELFDSLSYPDTNEGRNFAAASLTGYPNFRLAIDADNNPVLLFLVTPSDRRLVWKNYKLRYLVVESNVACRIVEGDGGANAIFTVITFTAGSRSLNEYFLRVSESLVVSLGAMPTPTEVSNGLNKIIEVFVALSEPPKKTVNGLWAEVFLIENSLYPNILLEYWHDDPGEKFDFDAGLEKIEVKSSSSFERVHFFSQQQLDPPTGTVLIASLFTRHAKSGASIQDLIDNIYQKIGNNATQMEKLNRVVCKTLGNSLEIALDFKFDREIARDSLKFYSHKDVFKIKQQDIPIGVSEVRYKSDLSNLVEVNPRDMEKSILLYSFV